MVTSFVVIVGAERLSKTANHLIASDDRSNYVFSAGARELRGGKAAGMTTALG